MENSTPASRPINAAEAAVVEACLEVSGLGAESLGASVDALSVVGQCSCGCASVDFAVNASDASEAVLLVQAAGKAPSGEDLMIGIWAQGCSISEMEVFSCTGGHAPLPVVSSIKRWLGAGSSAA